MFVPLREAYCLWKEHRLDFFFDLNLSKSQNEPLDSMDVGIYLRKKSLSLLYCISFNELYN
jgi:hypothetical protein